MNPFTESTVARPLGASDLAPARGAPSRGRRPFWRPALNALGLAAGLMLASAAQAVDVNVATHLNAAMTRAVRDALTDPTLVDPRRYLGPGRDAVAAEVSRLLRLLAT